MTSADSRNSTMKVTVVIAALALVAGLAGGVILSRLLTPAPKLRIASGDMSAVLQRLDLTDEQRAAATEILDRSAPRSRAIMLEMAARLRSVADSVDAELRQVLTAEQRAQLDSLRREPRLVLQRKMVTPSGTMTDTIVDTILASDTTRIRRRQ